MKSPPPWLRERDADELKREQDHLRRMQEREREAAALGFDVKLKQLKETEK